MICHSCFWKFLFLIKFYLIFILNHGSPAVIGWNMVNDLEELSENLLWLKMGIWIYGCSNSGIDERVKYLTGLQELEVFCQNTFKRSIGCVTMIVGEMELTMRVQILDEAVCVSLRCEERKAWIHLEYTYLSVIMHTRVGASLSIWVWMCTDVPYMHVGNFRGVMA